MEDVNEGTPVVTQNCNMRKLEGDKKKKENTSAWWNEVTQIMKEIHRIT